VLLGKWSSICYIRSVDSQRNLSTASREGLLAIIAEQQTVIAEQQMTIGHQQTIIEQLQQRIAGLEARLGGKSSGGPPGNKPAQAKPQPKKPRKRRARGFGRRRMAPTRRVEHALDDCPDCGTKLLGGWVQRTREVIEIPIVPVEVIEHVYIARQCPLCNKRRVPKVDLGGAVVGQQRLGVNLVSLIVTMREEGRLPIRTIQWYLATFHQLELSVGEIVGLQQRTARQFQPVVEAIKQEVRASPAVCGDETGWRQNGQNGYVWTFSTPSQRFFLRRGRNKEVVDEVLGDGFGGVVVSDFYAAYDHYPGLHQRCWPHLLRDIHSLKKAYPDDAALTRWAKGVQRIHKDAKAFHSTDAPARQRTQRRFERRLLRLALPFADDPLAVQAKLCRRIRRYAKELFVFVGEQGVPADNNLAERSLRHLVTCRKISGGTRSDVGTNTKMTLATVFGTWRAQGLDPYLQCRALLTSPQV
jgi:transposase